ncbi:hypothetical protein ACQPW1_42485 [Nocardia sp. CA-128927]|uniref:hypothetical protein n=1 Tax=Nocardia sp. CA-128927 TaxID=3239975 RepID=UPI003D997D31
MPERRAAYFAGVVTVGAGGEVVAAEVFTVGCAVGDAVVVGDAVTVGRIGSGHFLFHSPRALISAGVRGSPV